MAGFVAVPQSAEGQAATGSLWNTFMADTVGVVWRASSGSVDPWTKNELVDQATSSYIKAGMDPVIASQQAQADISGTLSNFTLGGTDKIGADPSQASPSLPSSTSVALAAKSVVNDNGSGCGITNLGGCYPSWLPYAAIGVGVIVLLWVLRPYVSALEE